MILSPRVGRKDSKDAALSSSLLDGGHSNNRSDSEPKGIHRSNSDAARKDQALVHYWSKATENSKDTEPIISSNSSTSNKNSKNGVSSSYYGHNNTSYSQRHKHQHQQQGLSVTERQPTSGSVATNHHNNNHNHNHHSSHHHSNHEMVLHGLVMILDGIGLAMVCGATLLEGVVLWKAFFHSYWHIYQVSLTFWFIGRACQIVGLLALLVFVATFETFGFIETAGMTFITIGPIFNVIAANMFYARNDPLFLFNKAWRLSEAIEFTGMATLCCSYIDMDDLLVFLVELVGFLCLCCAATMEFQFFPSTSFPHVEVRWDLVHSSECIGLMMLIVVSFTQYRMRVHKARMEQKHDDSDVDNNNGDDCEVAQQEQNGHHSSSHHSSSHHSSSHHSSSHNSNSHHMNSHYRQQDDSKAKRPAKSNEEVMMV